MHNTVICIGKLKTQEEASLIARYAKRLPWKLAIHELPESRAGTPTQRKADEAARMLPFIKQGSIIIALDERGQHFTSQAFADTLAKYAAHGQSHISFLIGGADGLDEDLRARAHTLLALGAMTWPHGMARVLLIEQLYRAYTIASGHPYHRA